MHAMPARAWLVAGGLALLPAWSTAVVAQEPQGAQEPQSAQALIDRIRQIQDELATGAEQPQEPGQAGARPGMTPEMTEQQLRTLLRDSLGVEVLAVEVVEHEGEPAYAVTVMMPPGNRNNALMAATLLVDGATGALLGQAPSAPRTPAPHLPTITGRYVPDGGTQDIRRRTWR